MSRQTIHWYAFGPFRIAPSERVLRNNGDIIPVAPKVFEILLALVESRGRVVQKEELLERIWPGVFVEEANLNVNMSLLRRVLGDNSRKHQYIETIPKRGYRFVAPVQELDEPCAEPTNEPVTGHLPEGRNDPFGSQQRERSRTIGRRETDRRLSASPQGFQSLASLWFLDRFGRINTTTVAGALCLLTVGAFVLHQQISKKAQGPIPGTVVKSLAVLPFKPLDPSTRDEPLELGIADTLIVRLSNLRQLIVRPTSAIRKFNALEQDPVAAGRVLGADVVLDGSFQRVDDKIRVTLRLVRVADGLTLWAGQFDEQFTNIFSLEDAITTKIANLLVLKLSVEEARLITKRPAADNEAYRLYLLGRFYWSKKTEEGLRKGLDYFQQAIARDPTYALAQAGLSDCYNSLAALSLSPPADALPKAEAAAKQAITLDEQLGEAHASLSLVKLRYRWDWAGAEQGFRHALELNPNSASTHQWFCEYLTAMGRFEEAFAAINRARMIDPLSLTISSVLGMTFHYAGRYDEAIAQQRKTIELDPNFPWAHAYLAMSSARKGLYTEAIAEAQKALRLSGGSPRMLAGLGRVYAQAGETRKAEEVLEQLHELEKRQYVTPFHTALIYEALGRNDEAFAWLDKAYAERSASLIYARVLPFRDRFRSDSRLADLLARMNLGSEVE